MSTTNPEAGSKEAKVSAAQARVLAAAAAHPQGIVEPTAKATERAGQLRTIDALARQGLIRQLLPPDDELAPDESSPGASPWMITAAGLRAIGAPDVMLSGGVPLGVQGGLNGPVSADPSAAIGAQHAVDKPAKSKRGKTSRDASGASGSKSELLLGLLRREKGASLDALIEASGWQAHSVRGFLSGTVRKRLGLTLISEKDEAGARRYRVES